MPRHMAMVAINSKQATGWFMDFKLERQQHLGNIAGFEP